MLLTIIIFIIILGLLVLAHEFGHFITAKRSGMYVEEFGFGFPPKLFSFKKGETTYSLNLIPFGGFVKILGEDGSDLENPKSFGSKGFIKRFTVLAAGVVMNAIFAWILISIGMGFGLPTAVTEGEQLPDHAKIRNVAVAAVEVLPDSPAANAGIKIGDKFVSIDGQKITNIEDVRKLTADKAGKAIDYEIKRGDTVTNSTITPRLNPPTGQGPLGVTLASVGLVSYPWYLAPVKGFSATADLVQGTFFALSDALRGLVTHQGPSVDITGPIGIAKLTGDVYALGFIYLLQFTAVLSINLAIINALPFPALDGGRVMFLVIEKAIRRKLPAKAEQWANSIGFLLLITLLLFVTARDIGRLSVFQRIKEIF
ncbi:MAG: M50 family metallopeptidase [Acidobacteriaceae bacterium]